MTATKRKKASISVSGKGKPASRRGWEHYKGGTDGIGEFTVRGTPAFMKRAMPVCRRLLVLLLQELKRIDPVRANLAARSLAQGADVALKRLKAGETNISITERDLK